MCIRNFLSKNNKTKNKPKYVRIQIKYLKFVANHDIFLLEFYFFFRSLEHFGQYHFPLGLVVRPTQAKWNHSIGHWKFFRVKILELVKLQKEGNSHQDCHIQSSRRTRLGDTSSKWAHLDQLACLGRRLDGVAYGFPLIKLLLRRPSNIISRISQKNFKR